MARLVGSAGRFSSSLGPALAALPPWSALIKRRYRFARIAAAGWVTLVLWGWVLAQFPLIIPPNLTINAAAAPARTLVDNSSVLVGGGVVLFPSLWYLLWVFKRRAPR